MGIFSTSKIFFCILAAASSLVLDQHCCYAETKPTTAMEKKPVLVELFTSEGCSSCPPADKNLIALQAQPIPGIEIITLSEHVTYWNYLGWSDPFSQEIFSDRQRLYASKIKGSSVYTPQLVIDGKAQIVGSNLRQALAEIKQAAAAEKEMLTVSLQDRTIQRFNLRGIATTQQKQATCFAAIVEDDLLSQVKSGENSGLRLAHNSVVREWLVLGEASAAKPLQINRDITLNKSWKMKNIRVVVFLQSSVGDITAVAQTGAVTR